MANEKERTWGTAWLETGDVENASTLVTFPCSLINDYGYTHANGLSRVIEIKSHRSMPFIDMASFGDIKMHRMLGTLLGECPGAEHPYQHGCYRNAKVPC